MSTFSIDGSSGYAFEGESGKFILVYEGDEVVSDGTLSASWIDPEYKLSSYDTSVNTLFTPGDKYEFKFEAYDNNISDGDYVAECI